MNLSTPGLTHKFDFVTKIQPIYLLLILGLIAIVLRGMIAKKIDKGMFLTMPIIGSVYVIFGFSGFHSVGSFFEAIYMILVAALAGTLFGNLKMVTERQDGFYIRSTMVYVLSWFIVFLGRYLFLFVIHLHANPVDNGWITWLYLTVYFVVRNFTIYRKNPEAVKGMFQKKA